jgi:hypothetical protein
MASARIAFAIKVSFAIRDSSGKGSGRGKGSGETRDFTDPPDEQSAGSLQCRRID